MNTETYAKVFPREFVRGFLEENCREDGRAFKEHRSLYIQVNNLSNIDGSSLTNIGNTSVVCGVKLEVGEPTLEQPKSGKIIVRLNVPSTAGYHIIEKKNKVEFNLYLQSESQKLQNLINDCHLIDEEQLCIIEGVASWVMYVDITVINDDGNIFDAAVMSMMHALKNTYLPHTYSPDDKTIYVTDGEKTQLNVSKSLTSTSFSLIDKQILVDPSLNEQELSLIDLSIVVDDEGNICGLFKNSGSPINDSQILECIQLAAKRAGNMAKFDYSTYPCTL